MNIGLKQTKEGPTENHQENPKQPMSPPGNPTIDPPLIQRTTSLEEIVENAKKENPDRSLPSAEILTNNQTLKSGIPSEEEGVSFDHFMDIASSFWSRKFEEKAQELKKKGPKEPLFLNIEALSSINLQDFGIILKAPENIPSVSQSHQSMRNSEATNFVSEIEPKNSIELLNEAEDKISQDLQWNSSQDELLLSLAFELKCDWKTISKNFNETKVTPRALRSRYNYLKSITLPNKARFSHEEDSKVLKYYEIYGTNWRAVANMLPGRTTTAVKNRFYSALRDKIKASSDDSSVPIKARRTRTVPSKFSFPELSPKDPEGTKMSIEENNLNVKEIVMKPRSMIDTYEKRSGEFEFECDQFFAFDNMLRGENQDEVVLEHNNHNTHFENIHNYDEASYYQGLYASNNQGFPANERIQVQPGNVFEEEEEEKKEVIRIVFEEEGMGENVRQEDLDPLNQTSNQFSSLFFDFPEKIDKGPYGKWG